MKIRNVHSFEVFDVVHWNSRGGRTTVSLDLDGRRYYSIELDGVRNVSSSENVTVAFRDDEEFAVLAWTDQTSQEVFHVGGSGSLVACVVFSVIALLLAKFTGILTMEAPIPAVAFVTIIVVTYILAARIYVRRSKIESAMRANAAV